MGAVPLCFNETRSTWFFGHSETGKWGLKDIWPQWQIFEEIGRGSFGAVYKAVREEQKGSHHDKATAKKAIIPSKRPCISKDLRAIKHCRLCRLPFRSA